MQTTFARSLRWPSGGKSEHPTTNSQHPKTTVAIFHLSVKTVSRSAGRSSTAAAAYRAGVEITDERTGEIHDYRRKSGVESAELFLPDGAPEWATDRAKLWNAAEQSETRKNSTVAREFEVALPAELSADQRRELAHDFTKALVKKYGFAADCAIHLPGKNGDSQNHHAHILCSTRKLTDEGFTAKTRELDDRATGAVEVVECRELFADMTNAALERAGHAVRVDHRSLEAQGIDRDAGIHLGPSATAIERRGEVSEKTQHHQERQQEAAGKVAAMVAIAEAQAKAATEIKEKENDRVRAEAFGRIGNNVSATSEASRATDRAVRAASGDLERAIQGAQRRVSERHYGRVVEAVRTQFVRVGRVVQQVADRGGNVVRTVALAAYQVAKNIKAERERKLAEKPGIDPRSRYHPDNLAKLMAQEAALASGIAFRAPAVPVAKPQEAPKPQTQPIPSPDYLPSLAERLEAAHRALVAWVKGQGADVDEVTPDGGPYIGPVMAMEKFHAVQKTGRNKFALHELANLDETPIKGDPKMEVRYRGGIGHVKGKVVGQELAPDRDNDNGMSL